MLPETTLPRMQNRDGFVSDPRPMFPPSSDADGCEANCTLPVCGNHIVDPGE